MVAIPQGGYGGNRDSGQHGSLGGGQQDDGHGDESLGDSRSGGGQGRSRGLPGGRKQSSKGRGQGGEQDGGCGCGCGRGSNREGSFGADQQGGGQGSFGASWNLLGGEQQNGNSGGKQGDVHGRHSSGYGKQSY